MQPFSIRHGKALVEQHIRVTMKDRLRQRLWLTVQKYDGSYQHQPDPSDNWTSRTTSITEQTEIKLKRLLGLPELKSRAAAEAVGLEGYFMKGYPSCSLEVIEQFFEELSAFGKRDYGRNHKGFEGAHDEFQEAREDLVDGKTKDVILKAFKSFESTLKTVLNQHSGDITELLRLFREKGFMDDIPEAPAKAVGKAVLGSLAILRNELAGHGQGNSVLEIPRHYAVLAIHLAGSLNQFVLDQHLRKQSPPTAASFGR